MRPVSGSYAGLAELVDVQDLGSCVTRRAGSSPVSGTNYPCFQIGSGTICESARVRARTESASNGIV